MGHFSHSKILENILMKSHYAKWQINLAHVIEDSQCSPGAPVSTPTPGVDAMFIIGSLKKPVNSYSTDAIF